MRTCRACSESFLRLLITVRNNTDVFLRLVGDTEMSAVVWEWFTAIMNLAAWSSKGYPISYNGTK